jgi:hypothetical protein
LIEISEDFQVETPCTDDGYLVEFHDEWRAVVGKKLSQEVQIGLNSRFSHQMLIQQLKPICNRQTCEKELENEDVHEEKNEGKWRRCDLVDHLPLIENHKHCGHKCVGVEKNDSRWSQYKDHKLAVFGVIDFDLKKFCLKIRISFNFRGDSLGHLFYLFVKSIQGLKKFNDFHSLCRLISKVHHAREQEKHQTYTPSLPQEIRRGSMNVLETKVQNDQHSQQQADETNQNVVLELPLEISFGDWTVERQREIPQKLQKNVKRIKARVDVLHCEWKARVNWKDDTEVCE